MMFLKTETSLLIQLYLAASFLPHRLPPASAQHALQSLHNCSYILQGHRQLPIQGHDFQWDYIFFAFSENYSFQ